MVQGEQSSSRRVALVIGNGAYSSAPSLKNPTNDAQDVARELKGLGFDVALGVNVEQREMKRLIRDFGQKLKGGGAGVFYYAGHGVQLRGQNYLIPVDAHIESEADVEDQAVNVGLVMDLMDEANNGLNIVILDACRNNPFARSLRSVSGGLAQLGAPTGTLIAYATAPGQVASDGTGRNGLYTSELLRQMIVPGLSVMEMFQEVRARVMKQTGGRQVPWESSSLIGKFYFAGAPLNAGIDVPTPAPTVDAATSERKYWERIKNSNNAEDFRAYLKEYPNGAYAALARNDLRRLEAASSGPPKPVEPTSIPTRPARLSTGAVVRNQMGISFVYIPAGHFIMGSSSIYNPLNDEKPAHYVTLREGFLMGQYEVTQAEWQAVMDSNPSLFKGCEQCPVENVSWNDTQEFIRRLNARRDGYSYRLPSEAEWEYACRAGTPGDYDAKSAAQYEASHLDSIAWYGDNSGRQPINAMEGFRADRNNYIKRLSDNGNRTHPVGQKQANSWGLYDMYGNVGEWCEDLYHDSYKGAPADGSAWIDEGSVARVARGSAWFSVADLLRPAVRLGIPPDARDEGLGFRLVAVERR